MTRMAKTLVLIIAVACPAGLRAQTYPPVRSGCAPVESGYGGGVVAPVHYETPGKSSYPVVPASHDSCRTHVVAGAGESSRPLPPRVPTTQEKPANRGRGLPSMVTVAGGLGIVLGMFFVLAWIMRCFTPQGLGVLPSEAFEVLGRAPLAGRQQAHLLRCGNKLLLVSVTPTGAETLAEVTDPDEVERLTALCRRPPAKAAETLRQVFGPWTRSGAAEKSEERHG